MRSDAPNSASGSDATSRGEPTRPTSEAEFLEREAADVRTAIGRSLGELRDHCTTEKFVGRFIGRHPWLVLAAASAIGAVLVRAVARARRQPPAGAQAGGQKKSPYGSSAGPPWWSALLTPLAPVAASVIEDLARSLLGMSSRDRR